MPLRARLARRGDAQTRPRGREDRDHSALRRLGGRRRVQRRSWPTPLLRAADRRRHGPRRQPGRPPRRGPDAHGRRRHLARGLGAVRRCRPLGSQRAELHRARIRHPRCGRVLGPRAHGRLAAAARPGGLGCHLRRRRRTLAPLRRDLLRAFGEYGRGRARGIHGGAPSRHRRVVRPQLPRISVEGDRRTRAGRGGEPGARVARRRRRRERGGLPARARIRGRGSRRRTDSARPGGICPDARPGSGDLSEPGRCSP